MTASYSFDAKRGLIVVTAHIVGPTGDARTQLALDTGATTTVIDPALLVSIGYDPASVQERVRFTTGSSVEYAHRLPLDRIQALGQDRSAFPVIAHSLPPSASVRGLLGLDFLRGLDLAVDFRKGEITLR